LQFAFTDEQQMLRAAVRGALERAIPRDTGREALEANDAGPLVDLADAQGWTGIGVPEELGGQGGGLVELAILFEELGRVPAPDVMLPVAIADAALAAAPGVADELRAEQAAGRGELALAIPADRLPDRASIISTKPHPEGADGWRLEGAIPLVLGATASSTLLVPCRTAAGDKLLAVPGSEVELDPHPLADLSRRLATVRLRSAPATPVADRLDDALRSVSRRGSVLVAADALGNGRRLLEMTVNYVSDRRQFGVPVGSFQAVKHAAAEALVELEAAHSAVYFAAWSVESGQPGATCHAAIAKWYATEAAARAADTAHALHGAVAFTWEHDLHFHLKRVQADTELLGGAHRQLDLIVPELQLEGTPEGTVATASPVIT
jgi:alkylation response protein AidB-like acyl-CoA dehydrogenase